jgi:hypothetical protein
MSKGLLAQWRRGIVARGFAAAALLAVPVGVAAAIGFGTSISGLTSGLSAIANGPDNPAPSSAATRPTALNRALAALAGTPTSAAGGGGGGDTGGGGSGGGVGNGGGDGGGGTTPTSSTGPGDSTDSPAQSNPPPVNPPLVGVPDGADPDGLVDQVGGTVDGLVGN